jgi:hypothetical protein
MQKYAIRPGRSYPAGEVLDLPDEIALGLIADERAIQVFDDPPAPEVIQTAALNATDHQRKTIQRPRKRNTNA